MATTVFVYSMAANKGKWSYYEFPFSIDAFAQLGNDMYIRNDDNVSVLDASAVADETSDGPVNFDGLVQWGWLDGGNPGATKMLQGIDVVASGTPSVSIGYDQRAVDAFTDPYTIEPDTMPGTPVPLNVAAPTFSVKIEFAGGEAWELQAVDVYLDGTKGQP